MVDAEAGVAAVVHASEAGGKGSDAVEGPSSREFGHAKSEEPVTRRQSIDATDVVSYLLSRHHLAAAFELFQDVVDTPSEAKISGDSNVDTKTHADVLTARDTLESFFNDAERFPLRAVQQYATHDDVPLLQASVRTQESRARVAEYDAELLREDLERLTMQLQASELEKQAAVMRRKSEKHSSGPQESTNVEDDAEYALSATAFTQITHGTPSDTTSTSLPPPTSSEIKTLNALVSDYLTIRGYKAAALTLNDEARDLRRNGNDDDGNNPDWSSIPDALRRIVTRANQLDDRDVEYKTLKETYAARSDTLKRLETECDNLKTRLGEQSDARIESERRCTILTDELASSATKNKTLTQQGTALNKDLVSQKSRADRFEAAAKHLEDDLGKKMKEWSAALSEERRKNQRVSSSATDQTTHGVPSTPSSTQPVGTTPANTMFSPNGLPGKLQSSHEEERTVRVLLEALPRITVSTLVAKRSELLPLFGRVILRTPVQAQRKDLITRMFDLVKRPEQEFRDALAATVGEIVCESESNSIFEHEIFPVLQQELRHTREERCVCAVGVLSALCTAVSPATQTQILAALVETLGVETCSELTRGSIVEAFATVCDVLAVSHSAGEGEERITIATTLLARALSDNSEHVVEIAVERAVPAFARRCTRGGCVADVVLRRMVTSALTEAIDALGGSDSKSHLSDEGKYAARRSLRLASRTLESVSSETNVNELDVQDATTWFTETGSVLVAQLTSALPPDDDTLLEHACDAIRFVCTTAGEAVTKDTIVPALEGESSRKSSTESLLLAAALPHAGDGCLRNWLTKYVEREAARIGESVSLDAIVAVRRAVRLLLRTDVSNDDTNDDPPADVFPDPRLTIRDAILDMLGTSASGSNVNPSVTMVSATLLGSAAEACPSSVAADKALPTLGALAVDGKAFATAALVRLGDAHCADAYLTGNVLQNLDQALASHDVGTSVAFVKAVREGTTRKTRDHSHQVTSAWRAQVAARVATITTHAFCTGKQTAKMESNHRTSSSSRRVLASATFGAVRGLLEADDEVKEGTSLGSSTSATRNALVPALRALLSDDTALDASERTLADAMLRDEDWRLVAAAEAAAQVAKEAAAESAKEALKKKEKTHLSSFSGMSSMSMSRMTRAMSIGGGSGTTKVEVADKVAQPLHKTTEELPISPVGAPEIDFATLMGEAAPTVVGVIEENAPENASIPDVQADDVKATDTEPPIARVAIEETPVVPETNPEEKSALRRGTSMSSKMLKSLPSAPKLSMPKNLFG